MFLIRLNALIQRSYRPLPGCQKSPLSLQINTLSTSRQPKSADTVDTVLFCFNKKVISEDEEPSVRKTVQTALTQVAVSLFLTTNVKRMTGKT